MSSMNTTLHHTVVLARMVDLRFDAERDRLTHLPRPAPVAAAPHRRRGALRRRILRVAA